jgi:hypothetical protein
MLLLQRDFRDPCFWMWQVGENAALRIGFLSLSAGDEGHGGPAGAMIAGAVGETVVLSAHGKRAARFAEAIEVGATLVVERMRIVATAEKPAGHGAIGTGVTVINAGAEAWHGFAS